MIKHIVSWEFSEENKTANLQRMKKRLEELPALISEIEEYEVGLNFKVSELAMDMVLISAFADKSAFRAYAEHPQHQQVVQELHQVTRKAVIVDFVA